MKHCLSLCVAITILMLAPSLLFDSASAAQDSVKIGVLLPTTGPDAEKGLSIYEGITTAQSFKPDIAGAPVTLISVDTESSEKSSAQAMKRLVDKDKVLAIIGETGFMTTDSGCALSRKAEVPLVAPALFDASLPSDCDFLFRTCFPDALQGWAGAWYAHEDLHIKNAAILIDISDEESIEHASLFKQSLTDLGGKIVAVAYCQSGDVDFSVQLEYIMSQKAELLFLPGSYHEVARFCAQALRLGYKGYMLSTRKAHLPQLIDLGGESVEGMLLIDLFDIHALSTELGRSYADAFMNKKGTELNRINALGADAYFVLRSALERAQSLSGQAIRKALADTTAFPGTTGLITLNDEDNTRTTCNVFQVKEGAFTYLTSISPGLKTQ